MSLLDLFYPAHCLACGQVLVGQEEHICLECLATLPRFAVEDGLENDIGRRMHPRIGVRAALALWEFSTGNQVQTLLHGLKYGEQPHACRHVGRLLGIAWQQNQLPLPDCLVFVPMHPRKERERGYNQAQLLALGIAEVMDRPVVDMLQKRIYSESQTRKNRSQRYASIAGMFALKKDTQADSSTHALLVDDVITTGATLERTAETLQQAGITTFSIAVVANVK